MADKPNPLKAHAIIVIIVGAVLLCVGAWGTIKKFSGQGLRGLQRAEQQGATARTVGRAPNLSAPKSIGGLTSQVGQLKQQFRTIMKILSLGWMVLLGGGMIFAGISMLKQKNWARHVGFAGIGFAILYFAGSQGASAVWLNKTATAFETSVVLPLVLVLVVAGLAAKPMFDIATEKFDA